MLQPKPVRKRNPATQLGGLPANLKRNVGDFWQWAYSDVLQNTTRGVLAEYILAVLLEIDQQPRVPWDAYDLKLKDGTTVEVKTMSKLQGWAQQKLTTPAVILKPTREWDFKTGKMKLEPSFNAQVYAICYFTAETHEEADPLNLDQWRFYFLSRNKLISILDGRKTLSLKHLEAAGVPAYRASEVKDALKGVGK